MSTTLINKGYVGGVGCGVWWCCDNAPKSLNQSLKLTVPGFSISLLDLTHNLVLHSIFNNPSHTHTHTYTHTPTHSHTHTYTLTHTQTTMTCSRHISGTLYCFRLLPVGYVTRCVRTIKHTGSLILRL